MVRLCELLERLPEVVRLCELLERLPDEELLEWLLEELLLWVVLRSLELLVLLFCPHTSFGLANIIMMLRTKTTCVNLFIFLNLSGKYSLYILSNNGPNITIYSYFCVTK